MDTEYVFLQDAKIDEKIVENIVLENSWTTTHLPSHLQIHQRWNNRDKRREVYIPVHTALTIKSVKDLDLVAGSVDLSFTMILRVIIPKSYNEARNYLERNMKVMINDSPFAMGEEDIGVDHDDFFTIVWRTQQKVSLDVVADMRNLPFDEHELVLKVDVTSIFDKQYNVHYQFIQVLNNSVQSDFFLDGDIRCWGGKKTRADMISFRKNFDKMAEFDLSDKVNIHVVDKPAYSTIFFSLNVYRCPGNFLLNYVFPLLVLSIGTLSVYAIDRDSVSDKLSLCVTMLLALFALLVTLRTQIPSVSYPTLVDKLVFTSVMIILLAMIDSVIEKHIDSNVAFYTFLSISVTIVLISCSYLVFHWIHSYKKQHKQIATDELVKEAIIADNKIYERMEGCQEGASLSG